MSVPIKPEFTHRWRWIRSQQYKLHTIAFFNAKDFDFYAFKLQYTDSIVFLVPSEKKHKMLLEAYSNHALGKSQ